MKAFLVHTQPERERVVFELGYVFFATRRRFIVLWEADCFYTSKSARHFRICRCLKLLQDLFCTKRWRDWTYVCYRYVAFSCPLTAGNQRSFSTGSPSATVFKVYSHLRSRAKCHFLSLYCLTSLVVVCIQQEQIAGIYPFRHQSVYVFSLREPLEEWTYRELHINIQLVPRSKHTPSRL